MPIELFRLHKRSVMLRSCWGGRPARLRRRPWVEVFFTGADEGILGRVIVKEGWLNAHIYKS